MQRPHPAWQQKSCVHPRFTVLFLFVTICDPMHSTLATAASTAPRMHGGLFRWARQPVAWVLLWAVWGLLALGYFAYRNALDGLICRVAL